jgi:methionyl-tRNA formyltransferase
LRTAYLGTSEFAATVLRRLADSPHKPVLVVTPPDRPRGRGRKLASPPAADAARELGIELHQTASVNDPDSVTALSEAKPEAVAVCAFGQLIKEPVLSEHTMLNVHPSLIPRWRGAAPIERTLMAGDSRTGMTIMRVTEGLDSGPVALQEEVSVEPHEGFDSLADRLATLGGELLVASLGRLADGSIKFTEQDEGLATYAEKISPEERRLDPARPAAELARIVRALNPHIGTHLELSDGTRLGVRAAHAAAAGPPQGRLESEDGGLVLGCVEGALVLTELQPPGKRPMAAAEYLRGNDVPSL